MKTVVKQKDWILWLNLHRKMTFCESSPRLKVGASSTTQKKTALAPGCGYQWRIRLFLVAMPCTWQEFGSIWPCLDQMTSIASGIFFCGLICTFWLNLSLVVHWGYPISTPCSNCWDVARYVPRSVLVQLSWVVVKIKLHTYFERLACQETSHQCFLLIFIAESTETSDEYIMASIVML